MSSLDISPPTLKSLTAAQEKRRRSILKDRQKSPNNVALTLLHKKLQFNETPAPLLSRLHALPQELQDIILEYVLLKARQRLKGFVLLREFHEAHIDPYAISHTTLRWVKLQSLVYYLSEMMQSQGRDDAWAQCHLVRIFAVHVTPTKEFLSHLHKISNTKWLRISDEAGITRVFMLAQQCARLKSANLQTSTAKFLEYPIFEANAKIDSSICLGNVPSFLSEACDQKVLGKLRRGIFTYAGYPRESGTWYFTIKDCKGVVVALFLTEVPGGENIWLSIGDGQWLRTAATITIKEWRGSMGTAELHTDAREPMKVPFAKGTALDWYLRVADPHGYMKARGIGPESAVEKADYQIRTRKLSP